ncbi:MAG TPA: hypothetical protein VKA55_01270 [Gammaproteobacteria bacterium]|nr:hypothetical protein [Gammaproteobacteria bacterium]
MPQEASWNDVVREVCQALARRDAIDCRPGRDPASAEACRQRRFWQGQARSRLGDLKAMVERAPNAEMARETLAELEEWADREPAAAQAERAAQGA